MAWDHLALLDNYSGNRIYANADPSRGNDANDGTKDSPVLTLTEAISRCRRNEGDLIIASSDIIHFPIIGFYAFLEEVVFNKSGCALKGRFTVVSPTSSVSKIALRVFNDIGPGSDIANVFITGGSFYGESSGSMEIGCQLYNSVSCYVSDCSSINEVLGPGTGTIGQIGFDLNNSGNPATSDQYSGNWFINNIAAMSTYADTIAFRVSDAGLYPNYLVGNSLLKAGVGLYVKDSFPSSGEHWAYLNTFMDNLEHCQEYDALHHWGLLKNYYDDATYGQDGWGIVRPWPPPGWTWEFTRPDPWPVISGGVRTDFPLSDELVKNILLSKYRMGSGALIS